MYKRQGGDGSQKIALELFKKGMKIVGVPKTIDNDLYATEVTFGFDTALVTATDAVDKIHTTAESHPVSYTHLDVYKRQDEEAAGTKSTDYPFRWR